MKLDLLLHCPLKRMGQNHKHDEIYEKMESYFINQTHFAGIMAWPLKPNQIRLFVRVSAAVCWRLSWIASFSL